MCLCVRVSVCVRVCVCMDDHTFVTMVTSIYFDHIGHIGFLLHMTILLVVMLDKF